jgi:putative redox protein
MRVAHVRRRRGYTHDLQVDGHGLVVDEPRDRGGADEGPTPTRLLAGSLAACTAITVEMYAAHKGWDLGHVEVDVDMAYDGPVPSSFKVTMRVECELDDDQVERLRVIAGKCPVHRVIAGETAISIEDHIERV